MSILLLIIMGAMLIGTSYAYFLYRTSLPNKNIVTTDCFKLSYQDSNTINLQSAIPLTDGEALRLTPYTFTIKNICDMTADYQINLETLNTSTINENYIKSKLDNNTPVLLGSLPANSEKVLSDAISSRTLTTGTLLKNEEATYNLNLYVDNDTTTEQTANKLYEGKVVVVATMNDKNYGIALNLNGGKLNQSRFFADIGDKLNNLPTPTQSGHEFLGWYTDEGFTNEVTADTVVSSEITTLYAKWNFVGAMLDTGANVNAKLKAINSSMKDLRRSTTIDESLKDDAHKISANDSPLPVYVYDENNIMYWYSESDEVFLNPDSANLFYSLSAVGADNDTFDLSKFNSSKVENFYSAFSGMSSLKKVDFSNFDTSNVTDMSYMFTGSVRLTELDLSNFDTSNVTNMSCMFMATYSLESLNISNFNLESLTNMDYMLQTFSSNLKELDLSTWDTSNVESFRNVFGSWYQCNNNYCYDRINISNWDFSSFDSSKNDGYGSAYKALFYGSNGSIKNIVARNNTNLGTNLSEAFSGTYAETIDLTGSDTSNVTDMHYMFSSSNFLKQIIGLNTFNTSNVENMYYMFGDSRKLTNLDVGNWNTSKVQNMSYVFVRTNSLESLDVSNWNTSSATTVEGMLSTGSSNLTSFDLSRWDTSKITSFDYLFNSQYLESLNISNWDFSGYTGSTSPYRQILQGVTNIKTIVAQNNSNMTNMYMAFSGKSNLESIDFTGSDTSNVTTMEEAFRSTSKLKEVLGHENFNTSNVTNMQYLFGYSGIESLDFSKWNTNNLENATQFIYGSSVKTVNISGWNLAKLPNSESELQTLFGDGKARSVETIIARNLTGIKNSLKNAFKSNDNLETVDLTGIDTTNVTSMYMMFRACKKLNKIDGLTSFNTSNVTDMSYVFDETAVNVLDLSSWNTSSVNNINFIFRNMKNLTTIYVSDKWDVINNGIPYLNSDIMFQGSTNLVGGAGTTYDSSYYGLSYAHIDGGSTNPGYLTDITDKPTE